MVALYARKKETHQWIKDAYALAEEQGLTVEEVIIGLSFLLSRMAETSEYGTRLALQAIEIIVTEIDERVNDNVKTTSARS